MDAICGARQEIGSALAELPRGTKKEPGYRYEDSNRYYRGRVLVKLREASEEGVELRSLGAELREGFTDEDVPWIYGIVRSLERDGLAAVSGERPAYAAVAEDCPSYGASDQQDEPGETRVRLP